jgi:hypothetical protein
MRDLLNRLYTASDARGAPDAQRALFQDILANLLASHAVAAAGARHETIRPDEVRNWIEAVAGYPGVTLEMIRDPDGSTTTIGQRAETIARHLLTVTVWKGG